MKKRLFLTYAVLLLVGFSIIGFFTNSFIRINYEKNLQSTLASNLKLMRLYVEDDLAGGNLQDLPLDELARRNAEELDMRVTFIDEKGVVLGDSEIASAELSGIENHRERSEFKTALEGEIGKDSRFSATIGVDYLYMAIPLQNGEEIVGAARLAYPMVQIAQINRFFIENILLSMAIALAISLYMANRYSKIISQPIVEITDFAKRIAGGDFEGKAVVKTGDEIEVLANAFNGMNAKLKAGITELRDNNLRLKSILTSMSEGLMAVDNEKRVILMNYPGKDFLRIGQAEIMGEIVTDVIDHPFLRRTVQDLLADEKIGTHEISMEDAGKTVLRINVSQIRSDVRKREVLGTIMIIQDITEIRALEEMRTEFVANVSHEIKTPLTSIAGFVETLKNGAIDNERVRDRFLNIIEIETERLSRLLDDLLILSNIEKSHIGLDRRDAIDANEVIRDVCDMTAMSAESKNIEIVFEAVKEPPVFYGNKDWFKQMILNLMDNAIKYTPEEGRVFISVYKMEEDIFVKIRDTGIGIPAEDIPRLFERFYRVDKARQREEGGTGLGLAIVKHIVMAFEGEIKVRSEEGRGTEFLVRIPYAKKSK